MLSQKKILFTAIVFLLIVLATSTILGKLYGQDHVESFVYSSPFFIVLWIIIVFISALYIKKRNLIKRRSAFMLHLSFVVILLGALITWKTGIRGTMCIEKGITTNDFYLNDEYEDKLPFYVSLESFSIEKYPGTDSPSDYISRIKIKNNDEQIEGTVSMNQIFSYNNYRFYQGGYDQNNGNVYLLISHDPYGILFTYSGYFLFILTFVVFFFGKKSYFRKLLKSPVFRKDSNILTPHSETEEKFNDRSFLSLPSFSSFLKKGTLLVLILFGFSKIYAVEKPNVLSKQQAAEVCGMMILYNGRIMPLETFARDFTIKIYGKNSYYDYTPQQVLTGWMFYYKSWKNQPLIKIKGVGVKRHLGIDSNYASYNDFITPLNEYKFSEVTNVLQKKDFAAADEKFNLIKGVCSGDLIKMFPHIESKDSSLSWYSAADMLPSDISDEKWYFIKKSMDYVHESIIIKDFETYSNIIDKIKKYQKKELGDVYPSESIIVAERLYNKFRSLFPFGGMLFVAGIIFFLYYYRKMFSENKLKGIMYFIIITSTILSLIFLTFVISLRWYISGHIPVANGFETMIFLAWSILLIALIFLNKIPLITISGFILSGLVIIVASISNKSPQITPLMPVLSSPLLCIHVVLVMLAYTLLTFIMMNGIVGLIISFGKLTDQRDIVQQRLYVVSYILLYPAILFLSAGIIIGAVWANISWGRYWGWDPKEVWALITLFIYSFALHGESIKSFRDPGLFHRFTVIAFLSVAMTYWGVNYLLGGLHSYAGG